MKTLFDDSLIAAALGTCVQETAPVLALWLEAGGRVSEANAQARRVLRGEVVGRLLADHLVDFLHSLDLPALIRQGGVEHRLTIGTAAGLPETLGFRFFPLPAGTLALDSLRPWLVDAARFSAAWIAAVAATLAEARAQARWMASARAAISEILHAK